MKNFVFLLAPLLVFGFGQSAYAQNEEGKSITYHEYIGPIMDKGVKMAHRVEEKHPNATILKAEFDLAHDDNYTYMEFEKGQVIVFSCFGDKNIRDLEMIVYLKDRGGDLQELIRNDENRSEAMLKIEIPKGGTYAIDVRIDSVHDEDEPGHFGLLVSEVG